jgi:hypothetical protein
MSKKDKSADKGSESEKNPYHRHDSDTSNKTQVDRKVGDSRKSSEKAITDWQKPPRPKGK